jgi:hypothetical protein
MQMRQKSSKLLLKRNHKHKQSPKYKLNHKQLVRLPRVKKHSLKVEISKLPLLVLGLQFQEEVEAAEVEERAEEKAVVKAVVNTEAEVKDKKVAIEAEVKAEAEEKEEVMLKVKPKELIQGIEQKWGIKLLIHNEI